MPIAYDQNAPRQEITLTVTSDLLHSGAEVGIDLLHTLESAVVDALLRNQCKRWIVENRNVLDVAVRLFCDQARAIHWLCNPTRGLGGKRPLDADAQEILDLIARLDHGLGA